MVRIVFQSEIGAFTIGIDMTSEDEIFLWVDRAEVAAGEWPVRNWITDWPPDVDDADPRFQ